MSLNLSLTPTLTPTLTLPVNATAMRTFHSLAAATLLAATTVSAQNTNSISVSSLQANIAACPVQQYVLNSTAGSEFPVQVQSTIPSNDFYVQYTNISKMLTNQFSTEQYLLTLNGASAPVTTGLLSFNLSQAKRFSIPFQGGVCLPETSVNTYLELLGVLNLVSQASPYSSSACINQQLNSGMIGASDGSNDTLCTVTLGANGLYTDKQANPDPKVIAVPNIYAPTMLGRAEYIKYISTVFNKEAAATVIYNGIQSRYQNLSSLANQAANSTGSKQTVAWVAYNAAYTSASYNSSAYWSISLSPSYKSNLTGDAGANFFNDTSVNAGYYTDATSWLQALKAGNVTTLIDETLLYQTDANFNYYLAWTTYETWLEFVGISSSNGTDASQYPFIQQQNVYRDDKSQSPTNLAASPQVVGNDDWFESALPNADAVLKDMISITQPNVTGSSYSTIWFRNIGDNQIRVLSQCNIATDSQGNLLPNSPVAPLLAPAVSYTSVSCPSFLLNPASVLSTTASTNAATSAGGSVAAMLAATLVSAALML